MGSGADLQGAEGLQPPYCPKFHGAPHSLPLKFRRSLMKKRREQERRRVTSPLPSIPARPNVATHCFCTPSLTFEFLFFLFVFGQVIVLCHCFSFTPLWISYGVWHRHERIECMVWSQRSARPYLLAGCNIFERKIFIFEVLNID